MVVFVTCLIKITKSSIRESCQSQAVNNVKLWFILLLFRPV